MSEPFGSFAALKNQGLIISESETHFCVERNFFISLLAKRIASIKFDEAWYLSRYPDVREAVKRRRLFLSGNDHYILAGYYEHRMPTAIAVDERWYLAAYPDVGEAIRSGIYKSGQMHFDIAGFREGRLPYANFQL